MRFTLSVVASVLAVANAAVIGRDAAALEVTLTPAANSASGQVIATVKNVGAESLNLVTLGTFLDTAPVDKLNVVDESGMFCLFLVFVESPGPLVWDWKEVFDIGRATAQKTCFVEFEFFGFCDSFLNPVFVFFITQKCLTL